MFPMVTTKKVGRFSQFRSKDQNSHAFFACVELSKQVRHGFRVSVQVNRKQTLHVWVNTKGRAHTAKIHSNSSLHVHTLHFPRYVLLAQVFLDARRQKVLTQQCQFGSFRRSDVSPSRSKRSLSSTENLQCEVQPDGSPRMQQITSARLFTFPKLGLKIRLHMVHQHRFSRSAPRRAKVFQWRQA